MSVGQYTAAEAARRAGLEPDYFNRLLGMDLVHPDADGTYSRGEVRRAQMTRTLDAAGIQLEVLAEAM